MRIAVITTSYPSTDGDPAGHFVEAEVHALANLNAAPAQPGADVKVIRPRPGGAFGWPGAATRIREKPSRLFEASAWAAKAAFELRRFGPERVIAHWCLPSAFPIGLAAKSAALEIVSHGGDVRLLCQLPAAVRAHIVRTLTDRAVTWRFVSEELRNTLAQSLDAENARAVDRITKIAPPALNVPDVREEAISLRRTIDPSRRVYVCAGRLVASKRVDKVIDYVATTTFGNRAERVLIVLGDGPERAHLERLAKAWAIDVRFLGKTSRRETLGWIGAADELVHASRVEGLSTVIREAESLGVPVTILS